MAITKIIAIRDRLDKRVAYVANAEKTALNCGVRYRLFDFQTHKEERT